MDWKPLSKWERGIERLREAKANARAFEAAYGTGTPAERNDLLLQAYHFYLMPADSESLT